MSKKSTTQDFIEKARKIHGDKYDYSKVDYVNNRTKVCIICPEHGEFWQTPVAHLEKHGCQTCGLSHSATTKRYTTEIFIEKAHSIHGDKYDYSKVEYMGRGVPVCIICPKHGEFWQTPDTHLKGSGCIKCNQDKKKQKYCPTTEEFIKKAYALYGDKYSYSKVDLDNRDEKGKICIIYHEPTASGIKDVEFLITPDSFLNGKVTFPGKIGKKVNLKEVVEKCKKIYGDLYDLSRIESEGYDKKYRIWIGCKKHGWLKVNMYYFMKGRGCKDCKKESHRYKYTTESYIKACKEVHRDKYDLSKVVFNGITNKVTVICPNHGEFNINAYNFLHGQGCKYCGYDKLSKLNKKPLEQYIEDCKKVHGNKYIIDETIGYTKAKAYVYPICPIHGRFKIGASSFLSGCGCAKCFGNSPLTTDEFISRAREIHNGFYSYDNTKYIDAQHKVTITCPMHGDFKQLPSEHLSGKGCKKCARQISKAEVSIYEFITSIMNETEVIQNDRNILNGKELDIFIPSMNIAIEYNGAIWHSEKFSVDNKSLNSKTLECEKMGIHLIHIFEDEWLEHKNLVIDKICHMLHKDKNKIKIGARKCTLKEISSNEAKTFLEQYHIQGWVASSIYCGAFYHDKLVGVMTFLQESDGKWNLTRFSSDINYAIPGLATKLFNFFIDNHNNEIDEVKTFLDRRWSWANINVYDRMGFSLDGILPPSYYYVKNQKRYHKFNFRKQILHKKYGLPLSMTEKEMATELGYYRIWDCGLYKYVWRK